MEQELVNFFARILAEFAALTKSESNNYKDIIDLLKTIITAASTILAALIVSVAGAYIAHRYNKKRDEIQRDAEDSRHANQLAASKEQHQQDVNLLDKRHELDKETEWRSHAIELTKLDIQRKLAAWEKGKEPLRQCILDFLANYRDLKELDTKTPAELYETIRAKRTKNLKDAKVKPKSPPPFFFK